MAQHSSMRKVSVSFLLVLLLHPLHGLNIPHEARSQDNHDATNVTLSTTKGNLTAENMNLAHPSAANITVSKTKEPASASSPVTSQGAPSTNSSADSSPKGSHEPATASPVHSSSSNTGANSTTKADHAKEGEAKEGAKGKDAEQEPEIETGLFTFASKRSRDFYVSGKKIPLVKWDVGPSYSGLLPTKEGSTTAKKGDRELFFWFFPATCTTGTQHLTVWLSGGAGCSSLTGVLEGNGPISWFPGQPSPTKNPHAWTNATSMLYVEQPAGVGYAPAGLSSGESQIANDFFGFMQNFLQVFPEMAPMKLYLAGESYAGMFIPYIADYIYQHQAKLATKLEGTLLIDPLITHPVVQTQIPVYHYVERHQDILRLNATTMATLKSRYESCGYKQYYDLHMSIPPKHDGPFQPPVSSLYDMDGHKNLTCDLWSLVNTSVRETNPNFNVYHISDANPAPWSPLGLSPKQGVWPGGKEDPVYFNRKDVKKALHAPASARWKVCKDPHEIFPHGDDSEYTSLLVLPQVIERSKKTIIVHGGLDFNLLGEGTRLAIQNMTWGGKQGFRFPFNESLQIAGSGTIGSYHTERNLTFIELDGAGQSVSMYEPRGSFQILEFLLDMRTNLSGPNKNSTADIFPAVANTTTTHSTGKHAADKKSPEHPSGKEAPANTTDAHPAGKETADKKAEAPSTGKEMPANTTNAHPETPSNTTDAHPAGKETADKKPDAPTGKEMPANTTDAHPKTPANTTDAHPAGKETADKKPDAATGDEMPANTTNAHPTTPANTTDAHPAGKETPTNATAIEAHPTGEEPPSTPAEHHVAKETPTNATQTYSTGKEPAAKPTDTHPPVDNLNGNLTVSSPEHDKDQPHSV